MNLPETKPDLDEALMWEAIPVDRWVEGYRLYPIGDDAGLAELLTEGTLDDLDRAIHRAMYEDDGEAW